MTMRSSKYGAWAARVLAGFAAFALAGCAVQAPAPQGVALDDVTCFSVGKPGELLPGGWRPWTLSKMKKPTSYRLVVDDGKTVVSARAEASASGLIHPLADLDPRAFQRISWRWKVKDLIDEADNTRGSREDSPVRLVVTFGGDMNKLDFGEKIFFGQVKAMTGQQLPYATLMYIWENRAEKDKVIDNNYTSRVKMVVAESGRGAAGNAVGRWQDVRRNLYEDYKRAFGEEPGPITSIGIMTDTDNTGALAHAWYGDIALHRDGE